MKTLNIKNRKKKVGYLIRRDLKDSWRKAQEKKLGVPYKKGPPMYLKPAGFQDPNTDSMMMGWVKLNDCQKFLSDHRAWYLDACRWQSTLCPP